MTQLLPGLKQALRRAAGVQDRATRSALDGLETWATELVNRLAAIDAASVSGIVLPIAMSDVTGLVAALAGKASTSHTHATADIISGTLAAARMPALTGDVTTSAGAVATTIANDAVTYAKMQNISANNRILGAITAGDTVELTGTQATAMLDVVGAAKGLVPASPSDTTKFLRGAATPDWARVSASGYSWFGLGFDGDLSGTPHFDGSTTVLGLVPASITTTNVYGALNTYTLTRDIHPTNMTVDAGVAIRCNGFRIFCTGTLTNNGYIHDTGVGATTRTGASTPNANVLGTGGQGGAGGLNGGAGTPGGSVTAAFPGWWTTTTGAAGGTNAPTAGTAGVNNGCGGGGGGCTGQAGGSGGAVTIATVGQGGPYLMCLLRGRNDAQTQWSYGSGGGGGGAANPGSGGGGGGGGGAVYVGADTIAGTGNYDARGGEGAPIQSGTAGNGGGGGGGHVTVVYRTNTGTITASAAGGTGPGSGTTKGGDGHAGTTFVLNLSGDGT